LCYGYILYKQVYWKNILIVKTCFFFNKKCDILTKTNSGWGFNNMKKTILALILLITLSACVGKSKEELYAEGLKQLEASNPSGAVVLFKNALEKDENYLDARYQLAKSYAKLGKLEQAEKEFNKVLKLNPSRDEVLLELAGVLNASKRSDEAFSLGEQTLVNHPRNARGFE